MRPITMYTSICLRILGAVVVVASITHAVEASANNCRYRTFGDLMSWGENTNWAQDWTEQYFACGVQNLSGELEHAFSNEWIQGNRNHRVYSMSTNSQAPLSAKQQNAKACAQLKGQIREYDKAIAQLDLNHQSHRDAYELYTMAREENVRAYNQTCQ